MIRWAQCNQIVLNNGTGKKSQCQSDVMQERLGQIVLPLEMEEGHRPGDMGNLWKLEKARKWTLQEGPQTCRQLDFSTVRSTSDF